MENRNQFTELKFENKLGIWVCECGAKYGVKIPNPNWCMRCKKEWLKENLEMKNNA